MPGRVTDDNELRQQFHSLSTFVEGMKECLEREIAGVRERIDRMDARFDKIAAGAHYVTGLVERPEIRDTFQKVILRRVQAFEQRMNKLQGNGC